jgi:PAS domain S-box-containing protein
MRFELWGITGAPRLMLPERPLGFALLTLYALFVLYTLIRRRSEFASYSAKQALLLLGLVLSALVTNQLFPISLLSQNQLLPLASTNTPSAILLLFGFAPVLAAGMALGPLSALLVGLIGGFSRAAWQSGQLLDAFTYAAAALFSAWVIQQRYSGGLYSLMRHPVVAALLGLLLVLPATAANTFAHTDPIAGNMIALDLALSTSRAAILPVLLEALASGLIVVMLVIAFPELRRRRRLIPSPFSTSINTRLVYTFLIFAGIVSFVLVVIGFSQASEIALDNVVEQMAHDAQTISAEIDPFRDRRQSLLVQAGRAGLIRSEDAELQREALGYLFRSVDYFQLVFLVNDQNQVISSYPEATTFGDLTLQENEAALQAINVGSPSISGAQAVDENTFFISFVVPITGTSENDTWALIGRVPGLALTEFSESLKGTSGSGSGYLLDEQDKIISHSDPAFLLKDSPTLSTLPEPLDIGDEYPGKVVSSLQGNTNTRQLVYYQTGPDHPWTIVITVPYEVILSQALGISGRLAAITFALVAFSTIYLFLLGRSMTKPLTELAQVTQQIASGSLDSIVKPYGEDEIGRLGQSFGQMQISLKRHLDEQALLLAVSKSVASSIDLQQGMPAILKGALRGTGAAGVRVVVSNHGGRHPLSFGEGPASQSMSAYDRQVNSLLFDHRELNLSTPEQVVQTLKANGQRDSLPKAMIALPLAEHNRYQGVIWLTYRQAHHFDQAELNFLRTLASQTSVLVENARLYAMAEGGRRRLAAVLSSTTDAVMVTDQTNRILLVNPSLEQHFGISSVDAIGRPVREIVKSHPLARALSAGLDKTDNFEIEALTGKVFNGSVSPIYNNDRQEIGRVIVLHDITYLKEIDELKSEFVATVSHDLRSPLTFMLSYASMLSMLGDLQPAQREYVEKIMIGITQMSSLIDNLLDLGRLEAGIDLVTSRFRIEEVLASVADEYRQPALDAGIELTVSVSGKLPLIEGDTSHIRQAVANMVSNVIKYAPDSGLARLHAGRRGNNLIISVQDNGPGIVESEVARIYEKFYRVEQGNNKTTKGTGLGLALVKRIAERHGGKAWCESQLGRGSTFYISLPIAKDR